jgi:hypothetical protein
MSQKISILKSYILKINMYVKFEYTNGVIGNGKSNNKQYNEKWHKDKKILSNHCAQN